MKRILSIISAVLICLSMLPLCISTACAESNYAKGFDGDTSKSGFMDTAGIVNEAFIDGLNDEIRSYAERLQMNIFIFTAGSAYAYQSDYQTEVFCDDTYDEIFGEDTDGVFYYIDVSGKRPAYDYISTSGKAVLMYEDYKDRMFSALDNYLPPSSEPVTEEHIINAVSAFCQLLENYLNRSSTGITNYYKDYSSGKYFYYKNGNLVISKSKPPIIKITILLISAIIGLITALIMYFSIKSKYKFKAGQGAGVYISHEETYFSTHEDRFLRAYTSKQRIQSSSSGSGSHHSGGGHHHSGGHGGGGHHR